MGAQTMEVRTVGRGKDMMRGQPGAPAPVLLAG